MSEDCNDMSVDCNDKSVGYNEMSGGSPKGALSGMIPI